MEKRLDLNKYTYLYDILDEIKNVLNVDYEIILMSSKGKEYGGSTYFKSKNIGVINISESLIKDLRKTIIEDQNEIKERSLRNIFKFIIGHELVHLKYKDIRSRKEFLNYCFGSKYSKNLSRAINIVKELRADIEGRNAAKLNPDECIAVHEDIEMTIKGFWTKKRTYKYGYPTRCIRKVISSKYTVFNEDVFREIVKLVINDFCKTMNIKEKDKFIEKIKNYFFRAY